MQGQTDVVVMCMPSSAGVQAGRSSTDLGADNGVPGPLQLVAVVGEELAVAHLQVDHLVPQLGHVHPGGAPAHLHTPHKCHQLQVICRCF